MDFINQINLWGIFNFLSDNLSIKGPWDLVKTVVDISIVSYAIYKMAMLVRETRAWQLIKGILFILIASKLSDILGLRTIAFILKMIIQYLAIALVVLFQPELRRGLEQIGRSRFKSFFSFEDESYTIKIKSNIEEIIKAVVEMSRTFTGALIVIERDMSLQEYIAPAIKLYAMVLNPILSLLS